MVTAPEEIKQQQDYHRDFLVGSMAAGLVYSGYLEQANAMILEACAAYLLSPLGICFFYP